MKIKFKKDGKEIILTLQPMDALDFYDMWFVFSKGQIKFSDYAKFVIHECVADPVEARDIEFFRSCPATLDEIVFQCQQLSKAGLTVESKIEIIEENEQKEEQNSISMKTTKGGN